VDELAARSGEAPSALAAALGRHYKRRGDLAGALRWYERAQQGDERAPELLVNVGNVRFLEGDMEGAKASYLLASDRAGGDLTVQAAAHYDLSKLYLRISDIGKSSAARDRAELEDGAFLRRHGADDDFSANRYLVDVPVPDARLEALAADPALAEGVREAARARLGGVVPRAAWPWAPLGLLAALWAVALLARRIDPSRPCEKCGRTACPRCEPGGGALCGQCLNVYVKKGAVEPRFRQQKELAVRRRRKLAAWGTRALAVLTGGGAYVLQGAPARALVVFLALAFAAFLVIFGAGALPPTHPSPWATGAKVLLALPPAALVYFLAVRDQLRRIAG
jgi:tetratricopeptide (TPR) repeat protein